MEICTKIPILPTLCITGKLELQYILMVSFKHLPDCVKFYHPNFEKMEITFDFSGSVDHPCSIIIIDYLRKGRMLRMYMAVKAIASGSFELFFGLLMFSFWLG